MTSDDTSNVEYAVWGVGVASDGWGGLGYTGMNLVSGGVSLVRGAVRVVWPGL